MSDPHSLLGPGPGQSARGGFPKDFVCLAAAVLRRGRFGRADCSDEDRRGGRVPANTTVVPSVKPRHGHNSSTPGWAWVWIERLWQDIRYGCRLLGANPGFTLVAVISLG